MTIKLTEAAARQIAKQLEGRGHGVGLRLGVKKSGCSCLAYVVDYADEVLESDEVFEQQGVSLVVAREHLAALDGMEVDYRREGLNAAFQIGRAHV